VAKEAVSMHGQQVEYAQKQGDSCQETSPAQDQVTHFGQFEQKAQQSERPKQRGDNEWKTSSQHDDNYPLTSL
jgi:hypothetical protein